MLYKIIYRCSFEGKNYYHSTMIEAYDWKEAISKMFYPSHKCEVIDIEEIKLKKKWYEVEE